MTDLAVIIIVTNQMRLLFKEHYKVSLKRYIKTPTYVSAYQ
jgi:hypothetical protein